MRHRTMLGCCAVPRAVSAARICVWLLAALAVTFANGTVRADQIRDMAEKAGIRILSEGDSDGDAQKACLAELPLNRLSAKNRQRAQQVIDSCSQFRRLPSLQYTVDEPMYRYLLQHPDVAVSTWRVMGISRFEMWQTGPMEYEAQAVDGSEGLADILYQDENQTIFICEGSYHNPLLPRPLQASALIWFRAQFAQHAEGTHLVSQKTDVFVRFPSAGVSTVAKVLTPVTNGLMDRNLFEVSLYASMMSRAVRDEPDWVIQVADQMEGVLPQRKGELIAVARKPRFLDRRKATSQTSGSADRSLIMSPELLFFDPPKKGTRIVQDPASGVPIVTADESVSTESTSAARGAGPEAKSASLSSSSTPRGNLTIIPASRSATRASNIPRSENTTAASSENELPLQPAEPPAGPTASGPVGRGPKR